MSNATFTSMDVSTKEEWMNIGAETAKNQPRVAEGILNMLRGMDTSHKENNLTIIFNYKTKIFPAFII